MWILSFFLSNWRFAGRQRRGASSSCRAPIRLNLEVLEARTTPAVFTVNSLADTTAVNFTTGQDAFGQVSLRSAIQAADKLGGAETILLPAGRFKLTISDHGAGVSDSSAGELAISGSVNLTLAGAGANVTTIDASAIHTRVFEIKGAVAQISGVTITGGSVIGEGGGIFNGGTLTLANSVLTGNIATGSTGGNSAGARVNGFGGGVYNSGALTITNSTISGNFAIGGHGQIGVVVGGGGGGGGFGGGIYNDAAGTVRINNSTLYVNNAYGGSGGDGGGGGGGGAGGGVGGGGGGNAITGAGGGDGGFGGGGGGAGGGGVGDGGAGGVGGGGGGGGYADGPGAGGSGGGGGGAARPGGAGGGGGGAGLGGGLFDNSTGGIQIFNSTFTDNFAFSGVGGSGYNGGGNGQDGIANGGGVFDYAGVISVQNTIIAANKAVSALSPDVVGANFVSGGYNLIGNVHNSSGFGNATDQVGNTGAPIDPGLGGLQDNGGPNLTCLPLAGSRAIDKGFDAGGAATDQRGQRRTFNSHIARPMGGDATDIGAVEVGSAGFTYVVGVDHSLTQVSYSRSVLLSPAGTVLAASTSLSGGDGYPVFAITSDNHLWRHGDVSGWAMLSAGSFQSISAATNSAGKAVVFGVLTDNSLWENNPAFGGNGWRNLSPAGTVLSISAITDGAGADLVFAITADHHLWEHTPAGWSILSGGNFLSVSADLNAKAQAEVFGILADNSLWEHNPAFAGDGWSNLSPAGTVLAAAAGVKDEVFAITADHHLWRHTPSGWSMLSAGSFASLAGGENAAEVFAVLTDNSLWAYNADYLNVPWANLLLAGTAQSAAAPHLG